MIGATQSALVLIKSGIEEFVCTGKESETLKDRILSLDPIAQAMAYIFFIRASFDTIREKDIEKHRNNFVTSHTNLGFTETVASEEAGFDILKVHWSTRIINDRRANAYTALSKSLYGVHNKHLFVCTCAAVVTRLLDSGYFLEVPEVLDVFSKALKNVDDADRYIRELFFPF